MKRILSIIISLLLVLTSMPNIAFAEETALPVVETTAQMATATPAPTATPKPTEAPTEAPTATPVETPAETSAPTETQTATPAETETVTPTATPADTETAEPDATASPEATATPAVTEPQSSEAPEETADLPAVSADRSSLSFDTLTQGYSEAQSLSFSLSNTGEADTALSFSATEAFAVTGASTLAAGGSVAVTVTPIIGLAVGSYQETLTVSAGDETITIALSVDVVAAVQASLAMAMLDGDAGALPAPAFVNAVSSGITSIMITWSEVEGASSYNVYLSTVKNGSYTSVAQRISGTSFNCTGLTCGTVYYFKVAAFDSVNNQEGTLSAATSGAYPRPATPDFTSASASSMYSNKLVWTALTSGCSGYHIYAQADNNTAAGFVLVGTRTSKSYYNYYHTGLTPNVTYTYYIRAYYEVTTTTGTTVVESEDSVQREATPALPVVSNFKAFSNGATSVKLTWTRESDVTGYIISRSATEGGAKTQIATINVNTTVQYIDESNLVPGTTYYYSIKTYLTIESNNIFGDESFAQVAPVPSAPPNVKAASYAYDKIQLTWSAVAADNADGYYIYRKPGIETDDFELIDTIYATTSYIDGNTNPLETGEAYFYYISAYRMSAGSRIEGAISATVNARSKPEQVQNLVVKPNTYTSLTLSWDACNGAAQYIILEKTWSAVTYSEIGRTVGNETTFDVDGLICGKIYYFRVVGIVTAEDDIVTQGEQSSTVSGRARPGVPARRQSAQ